MSHAIGSHRLRIGHRRIWAFLSVGLLAFLFLAACTDGAVPETAVVTTDASSSTIASTTTSSTTTEPQSDTATSAPTTTSIPPIYGYGDFSAYSYGQVPWDEVTTLAIACLRDHGVSVKRNGPTGIQFTGTYEQRHLRKAYIEACDAGLNLPDPSTTTSADIGSVYDFWLEQAQCLRESGYSIPDPPSRETFVDNYPVVDWVPYRFVPNNEVQTAEKTCPQDPYGE